MAPDMATEEITASLELGREGSQKWSCQGQKQGAKERPDLGAKPRLRRHSTVELEASMLMLLQRAAAPLKWQEDLHSRD